MKLFVVLDPSLVYYQGYPLYPYQLVMIAIARQFVKYNSLGNTFFKRLIKRTACQKAVFLFKWQLLSYVLNSIQLALAQDKHVVVAVVSAFSSDKDL